MYVIKSTADLQRVPLSHPCYAYVSRRTWRLVHGRDGYDPEADGYVVLLEPRDLRLAALLPEVPVPLVEVPWEGVSRGPGLFHGVVLTSNQFAVDVVVPDEPWLPRSVRATLEAHF
jgi:hypothetical protein